MPIRVPKLLFQSNSKQPQFPKIIKKKKPNFETKKHFNSFISEIKQYQSGSQFSLNSNRNRIWKFRDYLVLSGQSLTIPNEERATNESYEQQSQALRSF